jgi:amino acid adenylation domain-containing protein
MRAQSDFTYSEFFAARTGRCLSGVAASFEGRDLTYGELAERSDNLAAHLRDLGVGPEVLVAISVEPCLELLVALLAIWKAGGAYLPLDPQFPQERLAHMLADSGAALLLTRSPSHRKLLSACCRVLSLDDLLQKQAEPNAPTELGPNAANADNLAYVIYTSGSTGGPKGVEITHRSLLNHNLAVAAAFDLNPVDRVLQFASPSFDVSVEEIFPTWLSGATVVLRPENMISSIASFLDFVARERISVLNLPTAFWHELVEELPTNPLPPLVRLVVIGGEKASEEGYQVWRNSVPPSVKLINAYGPTETTITATLFEADFTENTLPIGRPISGTEAFILDEHLHPVPAGATGELFIGGVGLARGYRNRPDLTKDRFVPAGVGSPVPLPRLYRTGDLVRLRPDGNLAFIGRSDQQVKIRGFRIELQEVQSALLNCPLVRDAAVLIREVSPGKKRLVAYFVPRRGLEPAPSELLSFLKAKLPRYMVPSLFIRLENLPRTSSGKVDGRALPLPGNARPELDQPYVAPRTDVEKQLALIWQEVLHLEQVGVKDNFFELGGDSLFALQVTARVREALSLELPLSSLFEGQTIETLAMELDSCTCALAEAESAPNSSHGERHAALLSSVQERLWFLSQLAPDSDSYNLPLALRLKGRLDIAALARAIDEIMRRHEVFRCTFHDSNGLLMQSIASPSKFEFPAADLSSSATETELRTILNSEVQKPFNLDHAPLFRLKLIRLGEHEHVLLLVMHHSVSDGWSLAIFLKELELLYGLHTSNCPIPELPRLPVQYSDYAHWQRQFEKGTAWEKDLGYWRTQLFGAPGEVNLPAQAMRVSRPQPQAARRWLKFSKKTVRQVRSFAQQQRATPFMVLLAALAATLQKATGQDDLVIGTVVAGRTRREFENLIGCFMNFLPLRVRVSRAQTGAELLQQIRKVVVEAQLHQECPFEKIVSAINPTRSAGRNPLYNVALLWQHFPVTGGFTHSGIQNSRIAVFPRASLLDLRFEAEETGEQWLLSCEFNSNLLREHWINDLLASFSSILKGLILEPEAEVVNSPTSFARSWFNRIWQARRGRSPVAKKIELSTSCCSH